MCEVWSVRFSGTTQTPVAHQPEAIILSHSATLTGWAPRHQVPKEDTHAFQNLFPGLGEGSHPLSSDVELWVLRGVKARSHLPTFHFPSELVSFLWAQKTVLRSLGCDPLVLCFYSTTSCLLHFLEPQKLRNYLHFLLMYFSFQSVFLGFLPEFLSQGVLMIVAQI